MYTRHFGGSLFKIPHVVFNLSEFSRPISFKPTASGLLQDVTIPPNNTSRGIRTVKALDNLHVFSESLHDTEAQQLEYWNRNKQWRPWNI